MRKKKIIGSLGAQYYGGICLLQEYFRTTYAHGIHTFLGELRGFARDKMYWKAHEKKETCND